MAKQDKEPSQIAKMLSNVYKRYKQSKYDDSSKIERKSRFFSFQNNPEGLSLPYT